jgi:hypothetical protein
MHGEYSDHILDGDYTCTRCNVLDEDALIDERDKLHAVLAERDATIARVRALLDPDAEMARWFVGYRYFQEADIRRALDGEQP